ncbi:hypothetical protein AYK24_02410 [Thermoplasmatales archaeon SG8-52-4]|nr:MAG: hypothetical protein AYK24_02410 [Thermoplasmatales archaeon SG8-52-4]
MEMKEIENSDLIREVLKALYTTVSRRTTESFAVAVIDTIIRTIEERYDFLKHVQINRTGELADFIRISPKIDSIHPAKIGKSIEAVVQVVYMDLREKAGVYFINEVKNNIDEDIIMKLRECGVDLELLMLQQHYLYRRNERGKTKSGSENKSNDGKKTLNNVSILGYTKEHISTWDYDPKSKICILYDKSGKELDRLNLDTIIRNYIGFLTNEGVMEPDNDIAKNEKKEKIEINSKEFELLKILHAKDIDIETAADLLNVTEKQLHSMVHKLLSLEMLYYISTDEVALTDNGMTQVEGKK